MAERDPAEERHAFLRRAREQCPTCGTKIRDSEGRLIPGLVDEMEPGAGQYLGMLHWLLDGPDPKRVKNLPCFSCWSDQEARMMVLAGERSDAPGHWNEEQKP